MMKRVLIIYRFLPQYRVDFYNGLKDALKKDNIDLQLIYGKTNNVDSLKNDEVDIDWADFIPNRLFRLGKYELLWQPCLRHLRNKDLIIVEGANKLIINYYLMIARHFSGYRLAVWGHGRNMQIDPDSIRNKFKSLFLNKCDWYFAYTDLVKRFLIANKFPENKITVVQNAIDTVSLKKYYNEIDENEITKLKNELGIEGSQVGIFCGAMYPDKKLDFIIETCKRVKEAVPDFHMIFIGDGVDSNKVKEALKGNDWIHYAGSKFGLERVKYFKISSVQIMPGAVGLGVLDSFALETPLITTHNQLHGPEIEYLQNGVNGVIANFDIDEFSGIITDVLRNRKYQGLIEGCRISVEKFTINNMVENFKNGILNCLNSK